jgi:hypothetical protein
LRAIDGDEDKTVPRGEVEISRGVHCASFLLSACTTGMGRITPRLNMGNKRARALRGICSAGLRKLFLTTVSETGNRHDNGAISSRFLYSA